MACLLTAAIGGCGTTQPAGVGEGALAPEDDANTDADLDRLVELLTGWFDSTEQAAADPSNFFPIRLVMTPIWTRAEFADPAWSDGAWLYVEQASLQALEKPYRQRVYHVHRTTDDGALRSDVYTLAANLDPADFAGAWKAPDLHFAHLTPADLELRDGCSIILHPVKHAPSEEPASPVIEGGRTPQLLNGRADPAVPAEFEGATVGRACISTLAGAAYATSEVLVSEDRLVTWDRGFDAAGQQVWGATAGGYIFVRRGLLPATSSEVERAGQPGRP